jgi:surface protein
MRAAAMSNRAAILRCCLVGALLLASAVPARGISVRFSSWHTPVVGYLLVSGGLVRAAAARDAARDTIINNSPSAARGPGETRGGWGSLGSRSKDSNSFSSTATGVAPQERRQLTSSVMTDSNIYTAVAEWLSDATAAEATYGHISTWQTSGVTDMSYLFCADTDSSSGLCNAGAASFNEDISGWDTSEVTDMAYMFREASVFNRPIGGWAVDKVEDMRYMFRDATSFNQDIGDWTVDSVTNMRYMLYGANAFNQDISGWAVDSVTSIEMADAYDRGAAPQSPDQRAYFRFRARESKSMRDLRHQAFQDVALSQEEIQQRKIETRAIIVARIHAFSGLKNR